MKTALVIGGSRFIGPHLVKGLVDRGYDVTVFNRGRQAGRYAALGVEEIIGDRNNPAELAQLTDVYPGVVFDTCCYEPHQAQEVIRQFSGQIKKYIYISTIAAYREPQSFPITEEFPLGEWPLWGDYGINKARTDQTFLEEFGRTGFPIVIVRPTYVLGKHNHVEREAFFVSRLKQGIPIVLPGDGEARIHFVFAGQVAESMIRLAEVPGVVGEAYNVATDEFVTLRELVGICANTIAAKSEIVTADREQFPYSIAPFNAQEISPFANADVVVSNEKLKQATGMTFRSFADRLRETIAWFQQQLAHYPVKLRSVEAKILAAHGRLPR